MNKNIGFVSKFASISLLLLVGVWGFGCRSSAPLDEVSLKASGSLELGKPTLSSQQTHWHFYSWMKEAGEIQPQWTEQFHAHSSAWGTCVEMWVHSFADRDEFQLKGLWRSRGSGGLRSFEITHMEPFHKKTALCLRRVLSKFPLPPSNKGELGLGTSSKGFRQMPFQVDAEGVKTRIFQ